MFVLEKSYDASLMKEVKKYSIADKKKIKLTVIKFRCYKNHHEGNDIFTTTLCKINIEMHFLIIH